MKIKKITKSITMSDKVLEQLQDMMQYYGHNASAMIQIAISEYHGNKYRVERFGHQKGAERKEEKISIDKKISQFEAMTDEEINSYLAEIGFYTESELEEKEFFVTQDDLGNRVRRMRYKNGSMQMDDPFLVLVGEYKKFLLKNN